MQGNRNINNPPIQECKGSLREDCLCFEMQKIGEGFKPRGKERPFLLQWVGLYQIPM